MSGDYSRVRFDPSIDIAGVLMQQGRVQLDSDWNEWVAALDRRLRAESVDIFGVNPIPGIPGVAVVSPQTPEAFKINPDGGGSITIGRGRMYVDGLLAENHRYSTPENDDFGAAEFDPVLAELRGKDPLPYDKQPYFPNPPTLPANGSYLAYLEVWQREVTYHQLPGIVENAVGVDTTTRLQTVWQVRLLVNTSGADCTTPDDEIPIWKGIINPSAGRLSIQAVDVKNDTDPCELPPGGGYRGLENQLYRIEIHDGGTLGAATFKWSRENASVESNVAEIISSTKLKLASLGRDTVLRFNTGDWVEILDDRRELGGENGDPLKRRGEMRKITVDDAKQTISFSPALPTDLIPPLVGTDTLATRHTRVKRWDQKGTVRDTNNNVIADLDAAGSSGLIPVPAAGVWVVLENGIQVQFSLDPSGDKFRCGDYWVSAARTADASVEKFTQAPPRGIHRHYARLAMLTFPLPDNIDTELPDCRVHWPPDCDGCCTYTVGDGKKSRGHFNSIQDAVKALPTEGGRICVLAGTHYANVELQERSNIHISGCGLQTVIFPEEGRKKEAIFQIDGCIGIQLCDLTLVAETGAAIQVLDTDSTKRASRDIAVEQNHIIACTHAMDITSKSSNLFTNAIRIVGNEIAMLNTEEGESAIYAAADNVLIEDNLIVVVPHSDKALSDDPDSLYSLLIFAKTARDSYLIKENRYKFLASGGIQIAGGSEWVTIRRNRIVGGSGNGVTLGHIPSQDNQKYPIFMPELSSEAKAYIEENSIPYIYDITIEENSISLMGLSGIAPPMFFNPDIIDMMPSVEGLTVYRNRIEDCLLQLPREEYILTSSAVGFGGIVLTGSENILIQENRIENNGSDQSKAVFGILIFYGEKIDISGNRILNNGARTIDTEETKSKSMRGGIVIQSTFAYLAHAVYSDKEWMAPDGIPAIKVHDNIVTQPLGQALYLMAFGPVSVTGNHLTSQGADYKANPASTLAGAVFILNLGISKDLMMFAFLAGFRSVAQIDVNTNNLTRYQEQVNEYPWLRYLYLPSGTVLFANNQVLLDLRNQDFDFSFSSQLIASLDDVTYCNNQSECSSFIDLLFTDTAIFAVTQRCNDNRFQEGFTLTLNSLFSFGFMNTAIGNQATHCLQVFGSNNFVKTLGNTVLLKANCLEFGQAIAKKYNMVRGNTDE